MKKSKWRKWAVLAALLLLLLLGVTTWARWPNAQLTKAKSLQKELFSANAQSMNSEERRTKWQELRAVSEKLTPAQRKELTAEMRKRRQAEMTRYFSLSSEDRNRYLDEQISRSEQRRQSRQARGEGQGSRRGSQGGNGTSGSSGSAGSANGSAANGATGGNSQQSRDQRREERLDSTTPAERAQFTQYRVDVNNRRAQLGLPPSGGFGR